MRTNCRREPRRRKKEMGSVKSSRKTTNSKRDCLSYKSLTSCSSKMTRQTRMNCYTKNSMRLKRFQMNLSRRRKERSLRKTKTRKRRRKHSRCCWMRRSGCCCSTMS